MKRLKKWSCCIALSLCLVLFTVLSAAAAGEGGGDGEAGTPADSGYTYTVRFFSGQQGTIGGKDMIEMSGLHFGDRVSFRQGMVTLKEEGKYYVRGIRKSGEDNSKAQGNSFEVTGDADYVVAYGIIGSRIAYQVNYEDEAGNTLAPSETYYGNVGDKPVVAYLYIEGYRPQAYNLTKTLSENAAENEFTFVYTEDPTVQGGETGGTAGNPVGVVPATEPAAEGPAGAEPAGDEPGGEEPGDDEPGGGEAQVIDDEQTPLADAPEEVRDLDDEEVPLGPAIFGGNATLLGKVIPIVIAASAAGAGLLCFILIRRKKKKEERS